MKQSFLAAALVTTLVTPCSVLAAPVLTFNEATGLDGNQNNQSVGWQFNVTSAITVTGLGWYDQGGDGLSTSHTVGIWDPSGTLLTSVLVPSGVGASLDGQFRTVSIAPLTLNPGMGFIVGGENFSTSTDRLAANVAFAIDPRLAFVDATFSDIGLGFTRPTQFSAATSGFFGPSFSIESVPEPASLLMLALGSAAMGARARRRRASR